jgi:hypothetical protein
MFDSVSSHFLVPADEDSPDADLIGQGQAAMLTVGARMVCALRRLAGENGAALGDALRAMIMSREVAPQFWPVREAIDILSRADPAHDRQVERVLRVLEDLMAAIDRQED